jgi:predicted DNA-binding protein
MAKTRVFQIRLTEELVSFMDFVAKKYSSSTKSDLLREAFLAFHKKEQKQWKAQAMEETLAIRMPKYLKSFLDYKAKERSKKKNKYISSGRLVKLVLYKYFKEELEGWKKNS